MEYETVIYVYILIILIAPFSKLEDSIAFSVLSVLFLWVLPLLECKGLAVPHIDPPLSMARDLTGIFIIIFLLVYLVLYTVRQSGPRPPTPGRKNFAKYFM
jgi:hypothetical protein